jgi:protein O-GlcNAc transferase
VGRLEREEGQGTPARQQSTDDWSSETVPVEAVFERAGALHAQGQLDRAAQLYRAILQARPGHVGSLHNLAILCFQTGRYDDAVALAREVVCLSPGLAVAHNTLAVAFRRLGRLAEAEACCREALRLAPDYAEAHNTLGDVLTALRRCGEAEACCREALRLAPDYAEAHNNLGAALLGLGRPEDAERCCREALRLKPANAAALNNLGNVLLARGRLGEAEACCHEAVRLQPGSAEAHINLAIVLIALGRAKEAERCCREALRLNPGNSDAIHNLGIALSLQEQLREALAYEATAYRAVRSGQAVASGPDDDDAIGCWFYIRQSICDWSDYLADEAIVRNGFGGQPTPGGALRLLGYSSTPAEQLAYARRVAARFAVSGDAMFRRWTPRQSSRIRIGYLSAKFHMHPLGSLIAGLIEHHDRRRFEVIAYAFDADDGSPIRRRLADAFDRFVDITEMPDRDAAQRIHADAIDILVDLHGWDDWGGLRAKVLAYRPAPIQVNYLGYPATTGADFIDYIISDRFVIPPDQHRYFSEKVIYLPDCYQCNDDQREVAKRTPSRRECGLPERGFVFCCFNNSWRINPIIFDIWMRLLRATPESVLWLYEANPFMKANLAREAQARGIACERLVFAPRLPHPEHLARYRLADLFLDTLPYNAHTTASEALWVGLPLLTCAGSTSVGRVAGSLLRAVGLPELVTTSLEEYEAVASRLAQDAELLARLRARLAANRRTWPLFDTVRYARSLEAAYRNMWEAWQAGRQPAAFSVPASGELS